MNFVRHIAVLLILCLAFVPSGMGMEMGPAEMCLDQSAQTTVVGPIDELDLNSDSDTYCFSLLGIIDGRAAAEPDTFVLLRIIERRAEWRSIILDKWKRPPRSA